MFIDKDSLMLNNISIGQYLVEVKYNYPKLWGKDTGRNLAGKMSGSLIGIFPKIILQFRKLTKSELETLATILDSASQNLTYYDPNKKQSITIETYSGDYEIVNDRIINENSKNEGFSISLIAVGKRV